LARRGSTGVPDMSYMSTNNNTLDKSATARVIHRVLPRSQNTSIERRKVSIGSAGNSGHVDFP